MAFGAYWKLSQKATPLTVVKLSRAQLPISFTTAFQCDYPHRIETMPLVTTLQSIGKGDDDERQDGTRRQEERNAEIYECESICHHHHLNRPYDACERHKILYVCVLERYIHIEREREERETQCVCWRERVCVFVLER